MILFLIVITMLFAGGTVEIHSFEIRLILKPLSIFFSNFMKSTLLNSVLLSNDEPFPSSNLQQRYSAFKLMALINKRYASYYNTKYRLTGHVFEKRFYDKPIEDKEGMLEISRYIHLNPVAAKMVMQPEYYPWSSYMFYYNPHSVPLRFINIEALFHYYEGTEREKRRNIVEVLTISDP